MIGCTRATAPASIFILHPVRWRQLVYYHPKRPHRANKFSLHYCCTMINKELPYPTPPPRPVLTTRAHYVNRNLSSDQLLKHLKSLFCFPSFHLIAFIIFRRTGQIFHLSDPSVLSF